MVSLIKIRIVPFPRAFPRSSRMSARDTFENEYMEGTHEFA